MPGQRLFADRAQRAAGGDDLGVKRNLDQRTLLARQGGQQSGLEILGAGDALAGIVVGTGQGDEIGVAQLGAADVGRKLALQGFWRRAA